MSRQRRQLRQLTTTATITVGIWVFTTTSRVGLEPPMQSGPQPRVTQELAPAKSRRTRTDACGPPLRTVPVRPHGLPRLGRARRLFRQARARGTGLEVPGWDVWASRAAAAPPRGQECGPSLAAD